MAKLTILQMMTAALGEMGLPAPASVVNSQDSTAVQMLALANREAKECRARTNGSGGWGQLRKENVFQVQSTGVIPGCSYSKNGNVITIGTPPTQAPKVGWVLSTSGGSNATGFSYPTYVTAVNGSSITVSNTASMDNSNVAMAFGQESYPLPSDYDYMIAGTPWDRGFRWPLLGPLTPQEWQSLKSGLSPTGPRRRFRIMLGAFYLDPIPYDSNLLVYEYYSTAFATGADGSAKTAFTADTDIYVLPDDTMILGMLWRYKRAKGLDYSEEYALYESVLTRELGRDASAPALQLDHSASGIRLLSTQQIPDTGYGIT
ncbi:hypothetical protein [Paludibacterium sp.]|uniref:hypothetical protein n=1 Tax=Paludibacterium sp. TaxID=1917523 RepID=UPI0025E2A941|nr:hypothetical protein [Paludibacterium sp.]MBV8649685.1 hypothetical protein [Paludibacterium sp.]